jgi:excinuclease ABC subunit B
MAEDLTEFFTEAGVRVRYLHSDVDTLRRVELLTELRAGVYDVLVGINLLREGLDLPEVSLVAILDADKQGFLRSATSLIQTIGRAARNVNGEVHMYADKLTPAMEQAIDETDRRRAKQVAYNTLHGVDPQPLRKKIADLTDQIHREEVDTAALVESLKAGKSKGKARNNKTKDVDELVNTVLELEAEMRQAAAELQFELAARLRDEVSDLKRVLRDFDRHA